MNKPTPMSRADYLAYIGKTPAKQCAGAPRTGETGVGLPADKPVPQRPKKKSSTNALTRALVELLVLKGCHAWRQNNNSIYDVKREVFRSGSSTPGISDILGYCRTSGRMIAVEVKSKSDRLSPEQTAFLAGVSAAGGFAVEGRSVEQVAKAFDLWSKRT